MELSLGRLKHAWNAFVGSEDPYYSGSYALGASYAGNPNRTRISISNERSIIASIYTRIAMDFAAIDMKHVRLDENDAYVDTMKSGLNNCLTVEANIDQGARAFKQDIAMSMFDKGVIALVPVDTTINPRVTGSYDIQTMRVGNVVQWFPQHVRVSLYDERDGLRKELTLAKKNVAIIENPLYSVMNEPNSTLQRLIRTLNLLDAVGEQSSSGKLDLIIQLPYVIKSEARRQQADQRRKDIEAQLKGSQYGIAYTDGTEKVTQLNRPAENNLLAQVEYLTEMLYSQLGLTKAVFDGTADEGTMLNYYNRTIEPLLAAVSEGMARTFLTKTARSQMQTVTYFRDPFKLISISDMAEIADKFTRNEIMSSNEIRQKIAMRPSSDPKADELRNANVPEPTPEPKAIEVPSTVTRIDQPKQIEAPPPRSN